MSPGKRGPARGRPKTRTNASGGGAAAFKKKKDGMEVSKAQSTLASFFSTPKTKSGSRATLPAVGTTENGGSRGLVVRKDDSPKPAQFYQQQQQVEAIDVTDSNGASSNGVGAETPSSAAKALRFKLTSPEASDTHESASEKKNVIKKQSPFHTRGTKRFRQQRGAKSEVKMKAAARHEDTNDEDEDVIMSQPTTSPDAIASRSSKHNSRTPPTKLQQTPTNASPQPAKTAAAKDPTIVPGIACPASSNGRGKATVEKKPGQEGFFTPARTPPPSTEKLGKTTADSPSTNDSGVKSNVTKVQKEIAQQQKLLSENGEAAPKEVVLDLTMNGGKEGQPIVKLETAGTSSSRAITPKRKSPNSQRIRVVTTCGGKEKAGAEAAASPPLSLPPSPSHQSSSPHPNLARYRDQLAAAVASADSVDGDERRQDRQLGLQDAADSATAWKSVGAAACSGVKKKNGDDGAAALSPASINTTFPEYLSPLLARVVQGSPSPLSKLSEEALRIMMSFTPHIASELTASQVAAKISLVAQRKCYGAQSKKAVIPEDTSSDSVWRWEVQLMDLLPADKASVVRQIRTDRANVGKLVKALVRLTEVMTRCPTDAAKISKEEEKVMAFARKEEVLRQKASLRDAEVARKELAKREREDARDGERKAKEEERRRKVEEKAVKTEERKRLKAQQAAAAEEERKKQEEASAAQGTVSLLKFFKAAESSSMDSKENTAPSAVGFSLSGFGKKAGSPGCAHSDAGHGGLKFSGAMASGGDILAAVSCRGGLSGGVDVGGGGTEGRRSNGGFDTAEVEEFERRLREGGEPEELLARTAIKDRIDRLRKRKDRTEPYEGESDVEVVRPKRIKVTVSVPAGGGGFGEPAYSEEKEVEVRNRMKLLQFHQDYRPPYWGTWSKTSREVNGRRPLGRDTQGLVNYDYDSEADWEEEAQGEDLLSDEEGDKEPEDNLDYKDGWLRQDDEFSDEEIDRFDNEDGDRGSKRADTNSNDNYASACANKRPNGTAVIGVGEGVRLGAGAAAAGSSGNNGGQLRQQAFIASIVFRSEQITGEEARAKPALRALSAYQAVAFPFGAATSPGGRGVRGFPIAVMDALVVKPRHHDTGDEAGEEDGDEKGIHKIKKCKDVTEDILASLVEMLHGKATKREDIVNSFVALQPQCTKKAVHQKIKDVATRERSIRGGWVFVVREEIMERLGVESTSVDLKPSPAEVAAAAQAISEGGDLETGVAATPTKSGRKAKGSSEDKGKPASAPPPGQLSLLGFLKIAKGGGAGDSSPSARATAKVLFGPSAEAALASKSAAAVAAEVKTASAPTGPKGDSAAEDGASEPNGDDGKEAPARRSPGPDADGGWEECKESEPPMGRVVPMCNVLTPSKKVRQVAAARPVLYLGSGLPPPRRVLFDEDQDEKTLIANKTEEATAVESVAGGQEMAPPSEADARRGEP